MAALFYIILPYPDVYTQRFVPQRALSQHAKRAKLNFSVNFAYQHCALCGEKFKQVQNQLPCR